MLNKMSSIIVVIGTFAKSIELKYMRIYSLRASLFRNFIGAINLSFAADLCVIVAIAAYCRIFGNYANKVADYASFSPEFLV